jgi:dihydroflavonol-4-reductase
LDDLADQIEWVQADLTDPASLVAALRGCPLLFHAAAYYPQGNPNPWDAVQHGVSGMRNLLSAAARSGVKRVVYTSSPSTVGPPAQPNQPANEDDLYLPGSVQLPYFEAKWAMEQEALRASAQGLPVVVVIPGAVIGPGDVKPTTSTLLLMVARGRLRWSVEGTLNVIDGRDLAAGQVLAAERGRPGRRYIIGGHNLSIEEMLTTMAEAAEVSPPRRTLPLGLVERLARLGRKLEVSSAGQVEAIQHWKPLDTTRAKEELGLPAPRPFRETCQDTLEWFRQHDYLERRESKEGS